MTPACRNERKAVSVFMYCYERRSNTAALSKGLVYGFVLRGGIPQSASLTAPFHKGPALAGIFTGMGRSYIPISGVGARGEAPYQYRVSGHGAKQHTNIGCRGMGRSPIPISGIGAWGEAHTFIGRAGGDYIFTKYFLIIRSAFAGSDWARRPTANRMYLLSR